MMRMMTTLTATVPEFQTPTLKSTSRYFNSHGKFGVSVSQSCRRNLLYPSRVFAVSEISKLVTEFNTEIPLEKAPTPLSSWYTDPQFFRFELDRVFYGGWQAVGYSDQLKESRDYFTGRLWDVEFVVCRYDDGKIHAYGLTMPLSWLLEMGKGMHV